MVFIREIATLKCKVVVYISAELQHLLKELQLFLYYDKK